MKNLTCFITLILLLIGSPAYAQSTVITPPSNITHFNAGWTQAIVFVQLDTPYTNPGNCINTDGSYGTLPADPGSELFNSVLLTAATSRRMVRLAINGCGHSNRPRIVGVYLEMN